MPVIEVLLDPLSHLIIGNGNEAANVARIIAHNSTVNFKNVHLLRFPCAAFLEGYRMEGKPTIRIIVQPARAYRRDQRAFCFAARADGRPCLPLDHARSASQTARSSRACQAQVAAVAAGFRLRLGGGRCAPASFR